MRKVFNMEFDGDNPMMKDLINIITNGVEDLIIEKDKNSISIDASHVEYEKLISLAEVIGKTGFVKKVGVEVK